MDKRSELSKPVAYISECGTIVSDGDPFFDDYKNPQPIYSQEYVSALLTALRNIYAACDTGGRRRDGSQQGVSMPDWVTVNSVRALLESIDNG